MYQTQGFMVGTLSNIQFGTRLSNQQATVGQNSYKIQIGMVTLLKIEV